MRIGIDGQFATHKIKAGLFYQHLYLFRELKHFGGVRLRLFLERWSNEPTKAAEGLATLRREFDWIPSGVTGLPGRWSTVRLAWSALGRLDAFYHVYGGKFSPIPRT